MIGAAKALRIAVYEECFLSLIHLDTSTTGTIGLPALAKIFMLVQLILFKLVEDVGMIWAIAIPTHDDHFSNVFTYVGLGHQADLNILEDTISV